MNNFRRRIESNKIPGPEDMKWSLGWKNVNPDGSYDYSNNKPIILKIYIRGIPKDLQFPYTTQDIINAGGVYVESYWSWEVYPDTDTTYYVNMSDPIREYFHQIYVKCSYYDSNKSKIRINFLIYNDHYLSNYGDIRAGRSGDIHSYPSGTVSAEGISVNYYE